MSFFILMKFIFLFFCLYFAHAHADSEESIISFELSRLFSDQDLSSACSKSFSIVPFLSILQPLFLNFTGENQPGNTCQGKPTSCGKLSMALDYELFRLKTCLEPTLQEIRSQLLLIDAELEPFIDAEVHIMTPLRGNWSALSTCWHADSSERRKTAEALGLSLPSLSYLRHFLTWAYKHHVLRYLLNPLKGSCSLPSLRNFLESVKNERSFNHFTYIMNEYLQLIPATLFRTIITTCYDYDLIYDSHNLLSNVKLWRNASQCEADLSHYFGTFPMLNYARVAHTQCSIMFRSEQSTLIYMFDQLTQFMRERFLSHTVQEHMTSPLPMNATVEPILPPPASLDNDGKL